MKKHKMNRTLLGAAGIIAASSMLLMGLTEGVMAAELSKTDEITTTYNTAPSAVTKNSMPEGYEKANYKVVDNPLTKDKYQPTSKDLTKEEAAELGAQALWEIMGCDLEGTTFYMGYDPGGETFPQATWSGDIRFGEFEKPDGTPGTYSYYFTMDAVTGNMFTISTGRILDADVPLGMDKNLIDNPGEYGDLAEDLVVRYHLMDTVKSVAYGGQGYADNDPSITIEVTGTNGEKANLSISKYDKKLVGIEFSENIRIREAAAEKLETEMQKKIDALRQKGGSSESSGLITVE